MNRKIIILSYFLIAMALVISGGIQDRFQADTERIDVDSLSMPEYRISTPSLTQAKGPNGEAAVRAADISLTLKQIIAIKKKNYTAALLWAGSGEWYNALSQGAAAEFKKLNVEILLKADSQFDPAKQATDVETSLALDPDIILALAVDPVSGTRAFQPAVDAGITLVFADNGVEGYSAGEQYVAVVTGDHLSMGRAAADLMNEALSGYGSAGFIFHDADFFVTNNRDSEFKRAIEEDYPGIVIDAEAGVAKESETEAVAAAMLTRHPDIKGIYVAWDIAAEGVIAALRALGRDDVLVVTHDLGATNDLDMAMKGNIFGKVADFPYDIGATMARLAALNLLDEETPPFVIVPSIRVTRENLAEAWQYSLHRNTPENILKAL